MLSTVVTSADLWSVIWPPAAIVFGVVITLMIFSDVRR